MSLEAPVQQRPWSAIRWLSLIALVLAFQLACIFGLSDPLPAPRRAPSPVPSLRLAERSWDQFLALTDPTWFALPHRHGFSGLAWMKLPQTEFHPFSYATPAEYLRLPNEQPGLMFCEFIRTNDFSPAPPPAGLEIALTLPEPVPLPLSRERSELHLEGDLAHRALLTRFELEPWTNSVLLTNSVVRVLVNPEGRTQSAALLRSSGVLKADQDALARAAVARFARLPADALNQPGRPSPGLTEGYLVFEWHTVSDSSASAPTPGL